MIRTLSCINNHAVCHRFSVQPMPEGQRWGWPHAEQTERFPRGLHHFPLLLHPPTQGLPFHTSFPAVLSPRRLTPSPSGFRLLLLHHCSSVVTCSFGQLNCFHLWFPNASAAAWYFPSSAPFTASPPPLPLSVFLRLSSFIAPFLLFQLVP